MTPQKKSTRNALFLAAIVLFAMIGRGEAVVSVGKTLFAKGKTRLSVTGGWGTAFNENYFVLGAGAGYYLLPGLELGIDGESWMGSSPKIQKLSPELRYIFLNAGEVYPYIGGFYRRTFYEDLDDADSAGGRFGAYMPTGKNMYFGFGAVFERQMDCDTNVYDSCSFIYPEFTFTVAF